MSSSRYWELTVEVPSDASEGLTNFVWEQGALGVIEEEGPGRAPRLRAFFPKTMFASALEASVRYLAADLGPEGVRVNAISAGPVRTLAASGIAGFKKLYGSFADVAPLRANITPEDVGKTALYLCSDLASAVTGEVIYVDGGFNVMGVPLGEN